MTETPTEAREPDLPNNRASATAPMPKRKSAASVARAQRVIDFEARLARRGPSPATACSAHGAERGASLAARSRAVNRNVLTLQAISTYDHWMPPTRPTPHPSLRSMTGFGRAEAVGDGVAITVEARSVNHRHLDIAFRLPRALSAFEMDARRRAARAARRARRPGRPDRGAYAGGARALPGAVARAHQRAARRGRARRGAGPHRGGDLGGEDRRARGADPARRASRAAGAAPRQGWLRRPAAGLLDPGAEPRGQHDRLEGGRPRALPVGSRSQGDHRENARTGAEP